MKATDVKGLPVSPEGSQAVTGDVADLILDLNERSVLALLVRSSQGVQYVLPVGDVRSVMENGVVASRDAVILPLADTPGYTPYPTFDRIINQEAMTESGQSLGKLVNVDIDERSWDIRQYDVVESYAEAFEHGTQGIPASRVETGARMLMVKDAPGA